MLPIGRILGVINWILISIGGLLYITIMIFIYKSRRELRDVALLLTFHTCLCALLLCFAVSLMICSNLFGGFLLKDMIFCNIWGLFYDIFECHIYYGYCLQSFYRLCRIVFYQKRKLLTLKLYLILMGGQWLLILILMIPPVFVHWYTKLPTENYCLIPYTYLGPELYHILFLYLIPLICLSIVYIWITRFMRGVTKVPTLVLGTAQRVRNQRDLTVIRRILMLVSILVVLRFPTIIFMTHGAIIGSLFEFTYGIVGIITSICLILIGIITSYITPQLRKQFIKIFCGQNNQIRNEPIQLNRIQTPMRVHSKITTITQKSEKQTTNIEQNHL